MSAAARWLFALITISVVGGGMASGQNVILKDGRTVASKGLRRHGNMIMATVELRTSDDGGKKDTGEVGLPLAQIAKIDFPKPAQIYTAIHLIGQGKPEVALAQIEPIFRYYEGFLDAPGSWWAEAALVKAQALLAMGNRKEAEPLIDAVAHSDTDPETLLAAKAFAGSTLTRQGEPAKAIEMEDKVLESASNPTTLAFAAVFKGESHLALKQYDDALLSFLQIPVFYPTEKRVVPLALLGAGRAFFALEDYPRAKEALNQIVRAYGATPQAPDAQIELAKIARREKAIAAPTP